MWEIRIKFKEAKKIEDCHPCIQLKFKWLIWYKGLLYSFLYNFMLRIKGSKKPKLYWFDDMPVYWLITPTYGKYTCPIAEDYIRCINHEAMHGILYEVAGKVPGDDLGKKAKDGWNFANDYVAKYLPDVYCNTKLGKKSLDERCKGKYEAN